MSAEWVVVVPVKRLERAKSRLRGAVPGIPHDQLVRALIADTLAAALRCPAVRALIVVTDEPAIATEATALGGTVIPDLPDAGLNAAFRHGERAARGAPVAALAGDLPALRPADLAAALDLCANHRGFVADRAGTGTTLLAAPAGSALEPRFGTGSARAHTESGAVPLAGDWPSLRHDVDTGTDLAEAVPLGLGPRTTALLPEGPVA